MIGQVVGAFALSTVRLSHAGQTRQLSHCTFFVRLVKLKSTYSATFK